MKKWHVLPNASLLVKKAKHSKAKILAYDRKLIDIYLAELLCDSISVTLWLACHYDVSLSRTFIGEY